LLAGGSPPDELWRFLALLPNDAEGEPSPARRGARVVDLRAPQPLRRASAA
jgi:hypothetical protein